MWEFLREHQHLAVSGRFFPDYRDQAPGCTVHLWKNQSKAGESLRSKVPRLSDEMLLLLIHSFAAAKG